MIPFSIFKNCIIKVLFTNQHLQSNKRRDKFNYIAVTILTSAPSVKISYFRGFINYHRRRQNLRERKRVECK